MLSRSARRFEPPQVCRRPFGLNYAAMAGCSSVAVVALLGFSVRDVPMGSRSLRLSNQSTHSRVPNSTSQRFAMVGVSGSARPVETINGFRESDVIGISDISN